MTKELLQIIEKNGRSNSAVIPILQSIQRKFGYLPEEALQYVCRKTDISLSEIVSIASFYSQFRFEPAGKHTVKVCTGTACHVKGAENIYSSFKRELNIEEDSDTDDDKNFTVKKVSCLGCCSLAPAVQIDDTTYGHLNTSDSGGVIKKFLENKPDSQEVELTQNAGNKFQGEIRIGLGSCCVASGSSDLKKTVETVLWKQKINVRVKEVGCVGMCHNTPMLEIEKINSKPVIYAKVKTDDVENIIRKYFSSGSFIRNITNRIESFTQKVQFGESENHISEYSQDVREEHISAFLGDQIPIATEHRGILNPLDIEEYKSKGGFESLQYSLSTDPKILIEKIKASGIRGRGGAGFPTGKKWEIVAKQKSDEKYLICNGDEGDPGAFMDRMLLESYPYRIIEGMIIAGYACGINNAYFYIREEYPLAVERVRKALEMCKKNDILGENIFNSCFSFNIQIKQGAGAFVCGEETALISSIEGKRGFPSYRPPYPSEKGLWGKPTLINNTETFAQVPYILRDKEDIFSQIGTDTSKGSKVFALAGKISKGGLIEVPMGITIRQIVEKIGGGVQNNGNLKAVQIGGPSGACVPEFLADNIIDFESLDEIGAMMGSGGLVVLDQNDCIVDIAKYFLSFTQNESCGKCTFCRIGTKKMLDLLDKICEGMASAKDLEELEKLAVEVKKASLCGLGKTAPNPVISSIKYFRDEYEAHLKGKCPAGKCKNLIRYEITDKCIGCTICSQQCPVNAIEFKPYKRHEIDQELCIKCDNCKQVCPQEAVEVL